jgi:hypothetical protein
MIVLAPYERSSILLYAHNFKSLYVPSSLVLSDARHGFRKSLFTNSQRVGIQDNFFEA